MMMSYKFLHVIKSITFIANELTGPCLPDICLRKDKRSGSNPWDTEAQEIHGNQNIYNSKNLKDLYNFMIWSTLILLQFSWERRDGESGALLEV